jgi:hypothetical protein
MTIHHNRLRCAYFTSMHSLALTLDHNAYLMCRSPSSTINQDISLKS